MADGLIPRKRTLTDADMRELERLFRESHVCRFDNISCEEMLFMKDLITLYKETRSEILKWVIKGIVFIGAVSLFIGMYFKFGAKLK